MRSSEDQSSAYQDQLQALSFCQLWALDAVFNGLNPFLDPGRASCSNRPACLPQIPSGHGRGFGSKKSIPEVSFSSFTRCRVRPIHTIHTA